MSLRNCLGLLEPILGLSFSPFNYFFLPLNFKYLRKTTNSPFIAHDPGWGLTASHVAVVAGKY